MTVYKPIPALAKKSAEMAVQVAKGEAIQADTTVENGKAKVPAILHLSRMPLRKAISKRL